MKAVHSVPSLSLSAGGPSRSVSQLCSSLVSKIDMALVVSAVDGDELAPIDPKVQLIKASGDLSKWRDRIQLSGFRNCMADACDGHDQVVIHQHGIWLQSSHVTTSFANKRGYPLVLAPRGMLEPWALNHSRWKKKIAWAVFQNRDLRDVSAFHATALSEAESIRKLGFKQPIAVIPNGVELPEIGDRRPEIGGSENRKNTALFLSRINPKKGLPMLLDVWAKIAPADWRLVIAGNDDSNHLPEIEAKIHEHALEKSVKIVGPLFGDSKEQAFLNADIFVLPTYSENFGIVVTEALAFKVPVLTTTGCPWQELETHGCGWWVEPTHAGIEAGLRSAFSASPSTLQKMGARGRILVEEQYLWPGIAEKMIWFYQWLLGEREKPDFVI